MGRWVRAGGSGRRLACLGGGVSGGLRRWGRANEAERGRGKSCVPDVLPAISWRSCISLRNLAASAARWLVSGTDVALGSGRRGDLSTLDCADSPIYL